MFVLAKAVDPNAAVSFVVTAPGSASSNTAFNITVQAKRADAGNANLYTGTVHITCTDGAAVLPADAALVAGFGTFSVKLMTAGTWTFTATDTVNSAIKGTSSGVTVAAIIPGSVTLTSGVSWTVPVGFNPANNTIECYGGGGAGGRGDNSNNFIAGGGGGGGGYARINNLNISSGQSINYQIGFGGVSGGAGTATWFKDSTTVRGDPGQPGLAGTNGVGNGGAGGSGAGVLVHTGGTGTNGDSDENGGPGGGAAGPTSNGASDVGGGGLAGNGGNTQGATGGNYGGGAAGGSCQSSDAPGGTGAQGCIKITWS